MKEPRRRAAVTPALGRAERSERGAPTSSRSSFLCGRAGAIFLFGSRPKGLGARQASVVDRSMPGDSLNLNPSNA